MADLREAMEDLVTASHILANEGVLDSFGHVSIRHPENPDWYIMQRARAPQQIELHDLTVFKHDGTIVAPIPPAGMPHSERYIHGAIYEKRPEVNCVVHNHSESVIPFSVIRDIKLRPLMHMAGPIGTDINVWDSQTKFGDTNLLVTSMDMGRDLAQAVGLERNVSLLRGHGCVVLGRTLREAVFTSIYLEINASIQLRAMAMGKSEKDIQFLTPGESKIIEKARGGYTLERGWENWCRRVNRPYYPKEKTIGEGFTKSAL
jgi:ribulose-5-phosphate 4-epimerase/fuculose-1-phosphate aldolase